MKLVGLKSDIKAAREQLADIKEQLSLKAEQHRAVNQVRAAAKRELMLKGHIGLHQAVNDVLKPIHEQIKDSYEDLRLKKELQEALIRDHEMARTRNKRALAKFGWAVAAMVSVSVLLAAYGGLS